MAGRFISLEGGEGVGKSTQSRRLAAALRERGIDVIETREPGGSEGAEAIRGLVLEGAGDRWTAPAEALLFAAARADHVAKTIRPAVATGKWVLCDRYLDSSIAYQGGADGLGEEAIRTLHAIGSGGYLPDRTLLLSLPVATASNRQFARDEGKGDRFESRGSSFHDRVSATFLELAEREPGRFRVIDAEGSEDEVTGRLLAAIEDLF